VGRTLADYLGSGEGAVKMKLIFINGELQVDGTYARMKRLVAKINETEDRQTLKVLNREWWRMWFSLHSRSDAIRPARSEARSAAGPQHFNVPTGGRSEAHP
jgi:hypothetical protein